MVQDGCRSSRHHTQIPGGNKEKRGNPTCIRDDEFTVTQCPVVQEQVGRRQRGGRLAPGMGLFQTCWKKAEMRAPMGIGKQH